MSDEIEIVTEDAPEPEKLPKPMARLVETIKSEAKSAGEIKAQIQPKMRQILEHYRAAGNALAKLKIKVKQSGRQWVNFVRQHLAGITLDQAQAWMCLAKSWDRLSDDVRSVGVYEALAAIAYANKHGKEVVEMVPGWRERKNALHRKAHAARHAAGDETRDRLRATADAPPLLTEVAMPERGVVHVEGFPIAETSAKVYVEDDVVILELRIGKEHRGFQERKIRVRCDSQYLSDLYHEIGEYLGLHSGEMPASLPEVPDREEGWQPMSVCVHY